IVIASIAEFVIATTGVLWREPPPAHTDFASYYMAGMFAREHRSPYDAAALVEHARALDLGQSTYPFVYTPAFAGAMMPLARLPFVTARRVWLAGTTLALLAAVAVTWWLVRTQAALLGISNPLVTEIVFAAFVPAALN